jgi:hypothetical protein
MTRLTLALLLCATPALAEGCWDCEPPPKEDPPTVTPPTVVTIPDGSGGSAYDPYSRIYFASCTCDGMTVAWGFETLAERQEKALRQCEARRLRIGCELTDPSYAPEGLK